MRRTAPLRQENEANRPANRPLWTLSAALVVTALVATGCFGDDGGASDPPPTPAVEAEPETSEPASDEGAAPAEPTPPADEPASTGDDDAAADEPGSGDASGGTDGDAETYGEGVIPDEFALGGDPVAWRAATTSLSAMFTDVYSGSGLDVLSVEGDVILTLGGDLMAIDYGGVKINFAAGAAIPNVVIDGTLIGGVVHDGTVVSFTGESGGLTGTSTVLGSEIIVPIEADDLPLGTTDFSFEFDTSGDRLVIHPLGDAANTVWFPTIWLRVYD